MKCWRPLILVGVALCGIVYLTHTIPNAFAAAPTDQRTARRNFFQSNFGVLHHRNFELYVPQAQVITHYWRDNDFMTGWHVGVDRIVYPCPPDTKCAKPRSITVIQNNFSGNFEAIVRVTPPIALEGERLDVWHLDTSSWQWHGPNPLIADGQEVTGVTGDPVLIQSSWGNVGNFELFVPQGNVINHYYRDNNTPAFPWHISRDSFGYSCPPKPCSVPRGLSVIQSHYLGDGLHGNFEAVVRVGDLSATQPDHLDFWYFDSGTMTWHGPFPIVADGQPATNVTGDPVLIQSVWHPGGTFEVYVPEGHLIRHYYRDNDNSLLPWHIGTDNLSYACAQTPCPTPRNLTFIQSSFSGDGVVGNFEAIVQVGSPIATEPDHLDFWFLDSNTVTWFGPFTMLANGIEIEIPNGF